MTMPARVARRTTVVGGAVYLAVMTAIAALAAWPIYRSSAFVVLVLVATAVGAGVAIVARRRAWRPGVMWAALAGAVVVLGVPLAVPGRLGSPGDILSGLVEVGTGAVLGWKDLLTVDLPVGTYRNLLVPALLVFLTGVCGALRLTWRAGWSAYLAMPVALAMVSFGLLFGRTTTSAPVDLGPVTLVSPVETAIGVAAIVSSVAWAAWRTREERVRALDRAAASTGIHLTRRSARASRRPVLLGAGMVAVAVIASVALVPAAVQGREREVLRTATGPEVDLSREISPLEQYRAQFAPGREDTVLFTVAADGGALPERVRLATLDSYDGEVYRSGGDGAGGDAYFVRVPATREAGGGTPVQMDVAIDGLDGVWMPTAGNLSSVRFTGPRSTALADRFYYAADAQAGVATAGGGLTAGDGYRLSAVEPPAASANGADAPGAEPTVATPPNLRAWVRKHSSGTGGAALTELVALLRERGYLSHALAIDAENPPSWMRALGDYGFQPSASGHSLARIDTLFARLLERESGPGAATDDDYVAAIGDDEQFSVAVALIAQELGFPARVVVGARLSSTDPDLPVCQGGACRAQDLAAWTEVQTADGRWVALDVTPQHTVSPSRELTELRDPENVTDVRPDGIADVVPPPPVQEDTASEDAPTDPGPDLAWVWPTVRGTGIALLVLVVLLGPFLWIVAAKAVRRRTRRGAADPAVRVAAGWEELVDAAVDAGRPAPPDLTRDELAAVFGTPSAAALAAGADRAVFSRMAPTREEADRYWEQVDADRRRLRREGGLWRRVRAAVSLRSFVRSVVPIARPGIQSISERGRRRTPRARPST